jgi:hypothetical protein
MRTYNSKEPTICISLAEFQRLTLNSRVVSVWLEEERMSLKDYKAAVLQLEKEDMSDE